MSASTSSFPAHSANNRARRHVVTMLRMAGITLAGGRATDIEISDPRVFSIVYARGEEGLRVAHTLGWWRCADPPRLYAKLHLARQRGGECWSLQGHGACPPVITTSAA
jgi:hypothetical protein